jgi:hypothetical protein
MKLSDRGWQEENWTNQPSSSSCFDDALDFFDDSGVLDEPSGRVGYVLIDEAEVAVMVALNAALDTVLKGRATSFEEITRSREWTAVVEAADTALRTLRGSPAE